MSPFIEKLLAAPSLDLEIPPKPLQREIEAHAALATRRAFLAVLSAPAAPDKVTDSVQMAVALAAGPNGEVYSVTVIVQRKPPHQ